VCVWCSSLSGYSTSRTLFIMNVRPPHMISSRPVVLGATVAVAAGVAYGLWKRRHASATSAASCCCPPGSLPPLAALSSGETPARGDECQVAGLTAYVTGTANAERCVVVMTDVWGFRAGRHRQVCDVLASSLQCSVIMPDLFHGDALTSDNGPGTAGFAPWVKQWPASRVSTDLDGVLATVPSTCKVGVVGFCWGSFAALITAAGTSKALRAACFAHPSHRKVMENIHGFAPEDVGEFYLGAVRAPTLCLTAGNDDPRCKPGGVDEKMLGLADVPTKFEEFDTMSHGWVTKGDITDPETAQQVRRAVGLISGWLNEHL